MTYYLKKLGHQELGSIIKPGDKAARGRYIYISKDEDVLSFFPPLSRHVKNDSSLLPLIPLYLKNPEKVYCNYIYHNDKYNGSISLKPRDEFRIYSNNSLEMNKYLFTQGDIIVLKKSELLIEDEKQVVYFLDVVSDQTTSFYKECSTIINSSSIRGDHAVYTKTLIEIEAKIDHLLQQSPLETVIDTSVTNKIKSSDTKLEDLFNATSFRDFIMIGYEAKCAVTGYVIKHKNFMNLEAAHIKPRSHGGPFLPSNGIALSRDIHWAFDKGFFTLNDDYTIKVHEEIQSNYLKNLNGNKIFIPENDFFKPEISSITYHRENVFGLFLTSGKL